MGSHGVTCHPTQVNAPCLTPAMQAGTWFSYPGGTEGWVDLVDLTAPRPGVEPATFRSRVQRPATAPPILRLWPWILLGALPQTPIIGSCPPPGNSWPVARNNIYVLHNKNFTVRMLYKDWRLIIWNWWKLFNSYDYLYPPYCSLNTV